MKRYSNQDLITAVLNGEEDVLFYLSKKYFHASRRWLLRNGCPDADTPIVFSKVLVNVCREIQHNKLSPNVDFEIFFNNSLREYFKKYKTHNHDEPHFIQSDYKNIISSCFSILDDTSRKILAARYAEKLTFEQIAARFEFSNPVIAQFECDKAFSQFEKISRARLNVASQ
jgi:hypothetical protein